MTAELFYFDFAGWLTEEQIEGRSTEAVPPVHAGAAWPNWTGSEWVLLQREPGEVYDPRLSMCKEQLRLAATAQRWAHETGGITLPTGVQIKTGIDDQARITSVIANAHLANVTSVDFKAGNGWVTLTVAEIEAIAGAIALHVQACFAAERAHHDAIAALPDLESAQAYDVTEGWPA